MGCGAAIYDVISGTYAFQASRISGPRQARKMTILSQRIITQKYRFRSIPEYRLAT